MILENKALLSNGKHDLSQVTADDREKVLPLFRNSGPRVDCIHESQAEVGHRRSFRGRQIQRIAPQEVAKFRLRNFERW